jgi:chorismate synthase
MNSFGRILRLSVYGESHGPYIGLTVDGVPPGIALSPEDFYKDIERRKPGAKGTTPRVEADEPIITNGLFNGYTTGAPLNILFENSNTRSKDYSQFKAMPRPGHADFVASKKYNGFEDYRGGGHFSGRLTLLLVAAGVVAKKILGTAVTFETRILEIGGESDLEKGLQKAIEAKDSIGGIIECSITGLDVGIGEPFFDSVESYISHVIFSVPAVKGIEFGSGFSAARMFGSEHNDSLIDQKGTTETNHAGGIVGGISNGNPIVFRVAIKPTSSTGLVQQTYNFEKEEMEELKVRGRHDLCIALRAPVVIEAAAAWALADLWMITKKHIPND